MHNYDFRQLSPNDFELLTRDLIQARDGITLESFKTGRDSGIDFRHACAKGAIIVPCKHYAGTGLPGLLTDLKKVAFKALKLKPERYILATSVALTPQNKAAIQALFGAMLTVGDILGADDLNNLLGLHPEIEQQHYKLWFTSRAVLDRVIHNASLTQSDLDVGRVNREIHRYVRSSAYARALAMLDSDHVVIISGAPGVGKTSLAKMLLYAHLERGFEVISILTDFETGRIRYQPGAKQIFYFDDFLGATFLGERASTFTRNEDQAILDFIEMVQGSPSARLVMTTREHILQQAVTTSEKLKHSSLIDSRHVLAINDYSRRQRAEILYNHIYFSELPEDYRAALLADRFYKEIVQHKKFNPRLIEWLSSFQRVKSIAPERYQDFVRNLLSDPAEIWSHAYEQQISDAARSVLLALYSFNGKCVAPLLQVAFNTLHSRRAQRYGFKTNPSDWRSALRELTGSFILLGKQVEVIDPSVLDLLNTMMRQDTQNVLDVIEGAVSFEQARRIWYFALAKNSRNVFHQLVSEPVRVAAALEHLLRAPHKIAIQGTVVYFDDSPELRVRIVIQAAESLQSSNLAKIAVAEVESLLNIWEQGSVNISEGIGLLSEVEASTQVFSTSTTPLRSRFIQVLVASAATGCRSDELCELINTVPFEDRDQGFNDGIRLAAHSYSNQIFSEELDECKSTSEFEEFEQNLKAISDHTQVDFDDFIHSTLEAKGQFEDHEAQYEDHLYEEWKEHRHERQNEGQEIDNLFDSLRDGN
jgi:hypothetical protein